MATRRERVILDLEDNLSAGMIRAAAATDLLNKKVDALSRSAVQSRKVDRDLGDGKLELAQKTDKAGASIDKFSGRLGLLANAAAILGPALVPIGAIAAPAVAGLAAQLGFAALAGGTAVAAFQGVGDALKAMSKASLEPTTENIMAARAAMESLSPAAQDFTRKLQGLGPELIKLRDVAAEGMMPGLAEGLDSLVTRLPDVERILGAVSGALGDIGEMTGKSLASARWDDFFSFLATDAPSALREMATAAGNTGHAMAELWMAMDPLNDDFSRWMVKATGDLDKWATGLSKTDGFAEFMAYIETTGPQVGATLGALGNALLQIVEAAAPLGGPILAGIEAFADAIAAIADSDLGTPIFGALAAFSALNLAMRTTSALSKATFGGPVVAGLNQQRQAVQGLVGTYQGAAKAQTSLAAAQRAARSTTAGYVGMLQAANTAVSKGVPRSVASQARLNLALADTRAAHGKLAEAEKSAASASANRNATMRQTAATAGKTAGVVAGLAVVTSGAGDKMGLTNTASLALMGTMAGPYGAAIGAAAGLTLDLANANDDLRAATTAAGAAMKSGDVDAMSASYSRLSKSIKETQTSSALNPFAAMDRAKAVLSVLDGSAAAARRQQAALAGGLNGAAAAGAGMGLAQLAKGFQLTAAGARTASGSVKDFRNSVISANNAMARQGTFDAYRASLIDAREAAEDAGRSLRRNGDIFKNQGRDMKRAGLESRTALRSVAAGALEYAGNMKNAERRTKFMDRARGDFIQLAKGMGVGRAAAARLADGFGLADQGARRSSRSVGDLRSQIRGLKGKIVEAKEKGATESSSRVKNLRARIAELRAKTVQAKAEAKGEAGVQSLRAQINSLQSKTVYATTVVRRINRGASGNVGAGQAADAVADGGTIGGAPRYPYADKVLAYLAPGEEVISNRYGQADRHRALLQAINSQRYASGGTVGRGSASGGGGSSVRVSLAGLTVVADMGDFGEVVGTVVAGEFDARDSMEGMRVRAGA